ncbi:glycosyltransferase [Candidatus Pacearchaeota archaeon]|nr:glycosyltransferase [Candidatus Pacearchaeota archaeon]
MIRPQVRSEEKISCVIPTYNRCPGSGEDVKYNPPWWAANSLFRQSNIGEIVFVDDCSDDYFDETIERIRDAAPAGVSVISLRNERRLGLGKSRNRGVGSATNNHLFFMDDDCIIVSPDVLPKLKYAYDYQKRHGIRIGAMNLPVSGNNLESEICSSSEIGRVDRNTGEMHGCYTKIPEEYLSESDYMFIDESRGILRPLEVEFTGAVFICEGQTFDEAGGFPTPPWKNALTEDSQFIMNMRSRGYKAFYLPSLDRKFRVFHCRYGDPCFTRIPYDIEVDGVSFNHILEQSAVARKNTGCRVDREQELNNNVVAQMFFLWKYYGEEFALMNLKTKHLSMLNGEFYTDVDGRHEIFNHAVREGLDLIRGEGIPVSQAAERYLGRF